MSQSSGFFRAEAAVGCEAAAAWVCEQDLGRGELCQCYLDSQEAFLVPAELHTDQHKDAVTVWSIHSRAELGGTVHYSHTHTQETGDVSVHRHSWNLKVLWKANARLYGV